MREALFLPHDDVPKPTVALVLADAVPEPLVEDVVLLGFQLPLHRAVQAEAPVGQRRAFQNQTHSVRGWPRTVTQQRAGELADPTGRLGCAGASGQPLLRAGEAAAPTTEERKEGSEGPRAILDSLSHTSTCGGPGSAWVPLAVTDPGMVRK